MGRQAHLALLALGRSPFEPPELDQDGALVLGPHAHDLDNTDHHFQEYDDRGHPRNPSSRVLDRNFRDAKNDALVTVGLVVRKNEETKPPWQRKSREEKIESLIDENNAGLSLKTYDTLFKFASTWWISALRGRVQTFRSFSSIPLLQVIKSEIRMLGLQEFFGAGILSRAIWLISIRSMNAPLNLLLEQMGYDTQNSDLQNSVGPGGRAVVRVLDVTFFMLMLPISYLSLLRSLHLLPPEATLSSLSLIPFTRESPLQLPSLPVDASPQSMLAFVQYICYDPLILEFLHGYVWSRVRAKCYAVLCRMMIQPDEPDQLSLVAARRMKIDAGVLPGLDNIDGARVESLSFRKWLQLVARWCGIAESSVIGGTIADGIGSPGSIRNTGSRRAAIRLSHDLETELMTRVTQIIRTHRRDARRGGWEFNDEQIHHVELNAVSAAWAERNLGDPRQDIDPEAWLLRLRVDADDDSTTTPDPGDLFNLDEVDNLNIELRPITRNSEMGETHPQIEGEMLGTVVSLNIDSATPGLTQPTLHLEGTDSREAEPTSVAEHENQDIRIHIPPLTTLLSPIPSIHAVVSIPDSPAIFLPDSPREGREETPSPGLSRAQSLVDHNTFARRTRSASELPRDLFSSGSHQLRETAAPLMHHRVTALSYLSANCFASHAASLIATIVTLPLETMHIRSLTLRFLNKPWLERPGAATVAMGIRQDVMGIGEWFGRNDGMNWRYVANMFLLLGLQGMVSTAVWGITTAWTIRLGRRRFGWGQF